MIPHPEEPRPGAASRRMSHTGCGHPSRRGQAAAPQDEVWYVWRRASRAHRLDIVAVGVDQERSEIGRAVVGARTRAAIIAAAGFHALGVEFLDRGAIRCAECDMRSGTFGVLGEVKPQRRLALGPEARAAVVARTQDVSE